MRISPISLMSIRKTKLLVYVCVYVYACLYVYMYMCICVYLYIRKTKLLVFLEHHFYVYYLINVLK